MSFLWMAVITLVILQTSVFFTTIYLHRYKTHRGMELYPALGLLMHLELALFTGMYAILGGLAIFILLFGFLWGPVAWLTHVVLYILLNASINSVCHMIGYRNYGNKATNVQWIALLTAGEGLHNNHHEYPASALLALKRWEIDPAWPVIRLLEKSGLATVKQLPIAKAA